MKPSIGNVALPVLRIGASVAAIALLCGSAIVSCAGDPPNGNGSSASNRPDSHAMAQWTPNSAYVDECPQKLHDEKFVVGPDGKKYPTWHPPSIVNPDTNRLCYFGHEHGDDPSGSPLWTDIRNHFAYDANGNGSIDDDERAVSGIPFGYVNEQLDAYNTANGITAAVGRRYQPHTSYKIASLPSVLRRQQLAGTATQDFDLRCAFLFAFNQDTSSADAFASNVHALTYAADCNQGARAAQYGFKMIVSVLAPFGVPGSFDAGLVVTGGATTSVGGGTAVPSNSNTVAPGNAAFKRFVPSYAERTRDQLLALTGNNSDFDAAFKERWDTRVVLTREGGTELARFDPGLIVLDPARYFAGTSATPGRSIELCYSGLNAGGTLITDPLQASTVVRKARGTNDCTQRAPNGPATPSAERIAFDSQSSWFKNCRRQVLLNNHSLSNAGGAEVWYTNPFGGNGRTTVSATSNVKQFLSNKTLPTDVTLVAVTLPDNPASCVNSVHVPN